MLFDETYFEYSNINRKPLIWTQHKIITKFRRVWFWANYTKTIQKYGKILFDETYFEEGKINQNLFCPQIR